MPATVTIRQGDCLDVLPTLAADSIDACVTDPPYHLTSVVKRFGSENAAPAQFGKDGAYARASAGFMGKVWDGGDVAFQPETWAQVLRVLKPGGHLLAFGGTRTYHRMACAIEDAGFEIRDCIQWLYGSGFPKSHDVSKAIDRAAGAEREDIGPNHRHHGGGTNNVYAQDDWTRENFAKKTRLTAPATDAACQWEGWGTALKPACELIVVARKPLSEKTVAANVLKWGTGGLNIDASRVGSAGEAIAAHRNTARNEVYGKFNEAYQAGDSGKILNTSGRRWPANIIHDGSAEVLAGFPETQSGGYPPEGGQRSQVAVYGSPNARGEQKFTGSAGSASRFFYTAKADSDDRLGSSHPTVKPVDLMAYLCRLVTPSGGLVLDPFAGSGTTAMACMREGFHCILIERELEYVADIKRRIAHVSGGDTPLFAAHQRTPEEQKAWDEMWTKPFDYPERL